MKVSFLPYSKVLARLSVKNNRKNFENLEISRSFNISICKLILKCSAYPKNKATCSKNVVESKNWDHYERTFKLEFLIYQKR